MLFPQNPKVVIVDDDYGDVALLLQTFSKKGIPYIYLNGTEDSEPTKPFSGIRLLILDIDIEGRTNSATDEKSKASALSVYIKKIIDNKDYPYFILFWTKHDEIISKIIENLTLENMAPIGYGNLNKPTREQMENLSISEIEDKIKNATSSESFEYLMEWENSVQEKSADFVNSISNIAKNNDLDWEDSIKQLFTKLCCSYTGNEKIDVTDTSNMDYATMILNRSFSDSLQYHLKSQITNLPLSVNLSLHTIADLNTRLFFEDIVDNKIETGKIFIEEFQDNIKNILLKTVLVGKIPEGIKASLVGAIMTPSCDLAHNKFLKNQDMEIHRVVYGLLIENIDEKYEELFSYHHMVSKDKAKINECTDIPEKLKEMLNKRIIERKPENLFSIQPFLTSKKQVSIILFNFSTIMSKEINLKDINFIFKMKENLTFDLQSKLANHINRLGNSMLEY